MRMHAILFCALCLVGRAQDNASVPAPAAESQLTETVAGLDAVAVPKLLSYQGKLTDTTGAPVPNNNYSVTFRLYTVPTGGSPYWNETQTVATRSGLFTVLLGAVTPIGSVPDAGALYLGMSVAGGTELTPRLRIVSAAYAYKADTANYALAGAGGSGDNAWVRGTPDSVLFTVNRLGIARGASNNALYGNYVYNHINFGYQCTTGTSGVATHQYCTVGGGGYNAAGAYGATVAGGGSNKARGIYSTIAGGSNAAALDTGSTVGGGRYNYAPAKFATVAGGCADTAVGVYSAALSGYANQAGDDAADTAAVVAGGYNNQATGAWSTIGGGQSNFATAGKATASGGYGNRARGAYSFVGGGQSNYAGETYADTCAVVAGGKGNQVTDKFAFIGGGDFNQAVGRNAAVAAGSYNLASGDYAFVGGGQQDTALGAGATVGGGYRNNATGFASTVAGGSYNDAADTAAVVAGGSTNSATSHHATIGGGQSNDAEGAWAVVAGGKSNRANGSHSMVPGGLENRALGYGSFAAGCYARASHRGSFVWSDSAGRFADSVSTTNNDQFRVRARGGTWFFTNAGMTTGAYLAPGSNAWASACDSSTKTDFSEVDRRALLEKLAELRVREYRMRDQQDGTRHVGPVAQDFAAAFGYGENNTSINMADVDGVLIAAVQALYDELKSVRALNEAQQAELEALKAALKADR